MIEKLSWNQEDFEIMGWHDSKIYGFIIDQDDDPFTANLIFDIDYIFEWIKPNPTQTYFTFNVAPCTLIFKNAFDLKIDIETGLTEFEFEISDLHLKEKITGENQKIIFEWEIELQQGQISFKSNGFEQIVRQQPIKTSSQCLTKKERGGISFSTNK